MTLTLKSRLIGATVLAALMFAVAAPIAFAHGIGIDVGAEGKAKSETKGEFKSELKADMGLRFGHVVRDIVKEGKEDGKDRSEIKADIRAAIAEKMSHFTAGVVTAVNGSVITIDPVGKKKATTTITTDSNTVFKTRAGATTSAAITVGTKVFAMGTTTATSSTGISFTASLVAMIGKGFGHLHHWFWFR